MSVVGIDFGTKSCVVAVARRGGIDVVDNEASNRQTPTMVTFGEKQRLVGEASAVNFLRNFRSSVTGVKRLLGARWSDPNAAEEIKRQTCPVIEHEHGLGLKLSPTAVLTPEQVTAIVLGNVKQHAEKATQQVVRDVVIAVPGYWSENQRRAMLAAAQIAGLNVLRLINEHAAVALAWGIYKTDLHETEARKVLFVDVGCSSTSATVTAFVKGKLTVLSAAFDQQLGGRDFDEIIANALADEATTKIGVDPRTNPRAWQRILQAAEKQVKRVISAGTPKANIAIDNLANDKDFSTIMSRERFIELISPLLDRIVKPIQSALDQAKIKPEELSDVECIGGGMRLTMVQERVSQLLKRELAKTLNMEEVIARGCALMCAILSPVFRVREFKIEDLTPYPIRLFWKSVAGENEEESKTNVMDDTDSALLIPQNGLVPTPKMVSFARTTPIQFTAKYETPNTVPYANPDGWIGTYTVPSIPKPSIANEIPKLKVKAKLSADGTFSIEEAEVFDTVEETVEIEETIPNPPPPTTTATATATTPPPQQPEPQKPEQQQEEEQNATFTNTTPTPTPATTGSPNPTPVTPNPPTKPEEQNPTTNTPPPPTTTTPPTPMKRKRTEVRKKSVRKEVKVVCKGVGLDQRTINQMIEIEGKMAAADKLAIETSEAKNALESYSYSMRDKLLGDTLAKFGDPAIVKKLKEEIEKISEWLYGDGENETKGIYIEKLNELKKLGDPMVQRKTEFDLRPTAIASLEQVLAQWAALAQSKDEKYSHIDAAERTKVSGKVGEIIAWLTEKKLTQKDLALFAEPVLNVANINEKKADVVNFCTPIMSKPKPPPPKPATPPPPPPPANPQTPNPTEGEKPQPPPIPDQNAPQSSTTQPTTASPTPEKMDVDSK